MNLLDDIYKDGFTSSYIIVATASKQILDNNNVIIPLVAYDKAHNIIVPKALREFIEGVEALGVSVNEGISIDLSGDKSLSIEEDALDIVSTSSILRATLTSKIRINGEAIFVENMNRYVADRIAPELLHSIEDNLVVVHSVIGVSIMDRSLVALGELLLASLIL